MEGQSGLRLRKANHIKTLRTIKTYGISTSKRKTTEKTTEKSSEKVLRFLANNPTASIKEIANNLNLSVDGIRWNIKKLKESNRLRRIGPDKGGRWELI